MYVEEGLADSNFMERKEVAAKNLKEKSKLLAEAKTGSKEIAKDLVEAAVDEAAAKTNEALYGTNSEMQTSVQELKRFTQIKVDSGKIELLAEEIESFAKTATGNDKVQLIEETARTGATKLFEETLASLAKAEAETENQK